MTNQNSNQPSAGDSWHGYSPGLQLSLSNKAVVAIASLAFSILSGVTYVRSQVNPPLQPPVTTDNTCPKQ